jgi:hypothetical protein
MAKLQRSTKEEERRRKNLPKLMRRRWNDSDCADEDPISPGSVREREVTGGVEDEADGQ